MSSESSDDTHKLKIVLDTSVLVAAFLRHGLVFSLLNQLLRQERFYLIISQPILAELNKVLREKSSARREDIDTFSRTIKRIAKMVTPHQVSVIKDDPGDDMVIGTALAGNATLIVSLDRHLLKIKRHQNIGIVHPRTLTWILPRQ